MTRYLLFVLPAAALLLTACDDELDTTDRRLGYDYANLTVGRTIVYRNDSIVYDPISAAQAVRDTTTSYVRERLLDTIMDGAGETVYKLERAYSTSPTGPWTLTDVWTERLTEERYERTEENIRQVKLAFPTRKDNDWNATRYLDESLVVTVEGETLQMYKGWRNMRYLQVDTTLTVNGLTFEDGTIVELIPAPEGQENAIEDRYLQERYARGIGLIYRELRILDTQVIDPRPFEERALKGFILRQSIVSYQ